jgi:hypothetical protein
VITPILMVAGGIVLVAWNAWQRAGRTPAARAWTRSMQGTWKRRSVLVVRPLIAAVLILGGLAVLLADTPAAVALGLATGVCLLLLAGYLLLPLPVPRAIQPHWSRDERPIAG